MVNAVWSVSCLLFFLLTVPPCPAICKSWGHVPPVPHGVGATGNISQKVASATIKIADFSKTGNRNMVETCANNFSCPTWYSTSIVLGGLRALFLSTLIRERWYFENLADNWPITVFLQVGRPCKQKCLSSVHNFSWVKSNVNSLQTQKISRKMAAKITKNVKVQKSQSLGTK